MARLLFVDDMTEQALDRIGGFYSSGALAWAKAIRPDLWEQVLDAMPISGAKPRRRVFSVTHTGSMNCSR